MIKRNATPFLVGFLFCCALLATMGAASTKTTAALDLKLITPGASVLDPQPRSLYFASDGTVSVTNNDDTTTATIPVFAGTTMPLQPKKVTAASATVYGYYR
jgi:hypothetical protein